jgi:hypothetical protein
MRFHMILNNKPTADFSMERLRAAGIKTFIYTDDKDQKYVYDVSAGQSRLSWPNMQRKISSGGQIKHQP